jgi:chromosome segregation ATPase
MESVFIENVEEHLDSIDHEIKKLSSAIIDLVAKQRDVFKKIEANHSEIVRLTGDVKRVHARQAMIDKKIEKLEESL